MTVYVSLAMLIIIYVLCMIGYKKYKVLLLSGIVIAISIAGVILILINNQNNQIDGRLLSYEKDDEYYSDFILYTNPETFKEGDGPIYFSMDKDTMDDLFTHPEKYTSYKINIEVTNLSDKNIYDGYSILADKYEYIWLDTLFYWDGNLKAHETLEYHAFIIVKKEEMSDKEIDGLIKSIKIEIHATNIEYLNSLYRDEFLWLYSTKVIGFD